MEVQPHDKDAAGEAPVKRRKKKSWKPALGGLIALVILWQLSHGLSHIGGGNRGAPAPTNTPMPSLTPSPVPTVTLNGHGVAAGSGPVIVLNPGLVTPGGQVGVQGSGFSPGASVTIWLKAGRAGTGTEEAMSKVAKN